MPDSGAGQREAHGDQTRLRGDTRHAQGDATGDTSLEDWRQALPALVRMGLMHAQATRTPGWRSIEPALRRSGQSAANAIDAGRARDVAMEVKANAAVWGVFRREPAGWVADATMLRIEGETPPVAIRVAAPRWVDLAESLILKVAEALDRRIPEEEWRHWRMGVTDREVTAGAFAKAIALQVRGVPVAEQEAAWREVLASDARCGLAHVSLLDLLVEADRKADCASAAEEFLRQQPDSCEAHLAHALVLWMREDMGGAEAEMREALRLHRGCPEAIRAVFDLLSRLKRWADLAVLLRQAWADRPDDAAAPVLLAAALSQAGDLEGARDLLDEIEDLPGEGDIVDLALLQAALAVGHVELAGRELQRLGPKTATDAMIRATLESTTVGIRPRADGKALPAVVPPRSFTPDELKAELDRRLTPEDRALVVNPLEITPELAAEARRLTTGLTNNALRAFALFADVARRGRGSGDGERRTAAEALRKSTDPETRFSCQEYAKLFVAMVRAIGLDAWLVHVERCADGSSAYHDCAAFLLNGQSVLVDPTWRLFCALHEEFVVLDDVQAVSHQAMQSQLKPNAALLRAGLKLNPNDRWTRLQFVRGMAGLGEVELAAAELSQLQSDGRDTWDVHDAAAVIEMARRRWKPALAELQRALALSPINPVVHLRLAAVYTELDDSVNSAEHIRKALAFDRGELPKDHRRASQLGFEMMTAVSQARSGAAGSLETLERRAESGDIPARMALAKACLEAQPPRTEEGMRWLLKAAEQGDAQAQFNYARNVLVLRGPEASKEAVTWLNRSAGQGDDDAQYLLGLIGKLLFMDLDLAGPFRRQGNQAKSRQGLEIEPRGTVLGAQAQGLAEGALGEVEFVPLEMV